MQTGVKPKATENSRDFVVVPSDQVKVAPSDAEITNLLRAAARHHSEAGARVASDPSVPATVPVVDATFRATDVNEGVSAKGSFARRLMRTAGALLLALGIGAAAMSWQTFGYAAKKALISWAPKWAIAASLPLDKLGLGNNSTPSDDVAEATPAQPAPEQSASNGSTSESAAAAAPSDAAQQLQSMARDLASANQEIEALRASIAELKAGQQQATRDLAKVTDKLAEQNAKPKLAAAAPRPPAPAVHRPAPVYSSTGYAPAATPAPPPVYRPASSPYSAQASVTPSPPPVAAQQPYAPPPTQIQPPADPGVVGSAPRPPMPLSQ
jgi:hypothetical protein